MYNECSYCITEALQVYIPVHNMYRGGIYKPIKLLLLIPVCICPCNYICCGFHGVKCANRAKHEPVYVAVYSHVSIQLAS